jgi:hypothetical protein
LFSSRVRAANQRSSTMLTGGLSARILANRVRSHLKDNASLSPIHLGQLAGDRCLAM